MAINDSFETIDQALKASYSTAQGEQKELLADARNALADLKVEFAEIKTRSQSLTDKQTLRDQLDKEKGHDWLVLQGDSHPARRYCPVCFYNDDKLIPLSDPLTGLWFNGQRPCPVCKGNIS